MHRLAALALALMPSLAWGQSPTFQNMTVTGNLTGNTTATGSTTARSLADRAAELINVRDFGARCDNATDDSAAFIAAINRVNTLQLAGSTTVIYVPPGKCLIKGANGALPRFAQNTMGGVVGEGPQRSWIIMDASYTGDLFSWSVSWMDGDFPNPLVNTPSDTVRTASVKAGPLVRGVSIVGNRSAASAQYGLHFYDRNDFVRVENVDFFYVKGGAISSGATSLGGTVSGMRESSFSNVRIFNSGDTGIPAFGFTAVGSAGGTPIKFTDIDIYGSYGPGLSIRNNGTNPIGGYYFNKLRVEGLESNPPGVAADNIVIGDPGETGAISNISIQQANLLSPYAGFCALRVTGADAPTRPVNIEVQGSIGAGGASAGKGLCLDAIRNGRFQMVISSTDVNYTLGPLVGTGVTIDLNGAGPATVTSTVDAAAQRVIQTPVYTLGDLVSQKMSFSLTPHDGSITGGNGMAPGGVDLQMIRGQAVHAATSAFATIGGGLDNQAAGNSCTIGGGNLNLCTGQFSAIPGGSNAADQGRQALLAFAMGRYVNNGDAQIASAVLRGSGSTAAAFRLTSGAAAANNVSGTQNCFNIANNFGFGMRIHLHARNNTTPGQDYDWFMPNAMLTRDAAIATTALALGTPVTLTRGTVTGAAVAAAADTANGCLSLTFAPPTANTTDIWHAVARIDSVEVQ